MTTTRCAHGLICLVNAGRALHPLLLDPCGRMPAVNPIGPVDEMILTNHRVVRDGSWWKCMHCERREPFGKLLDWGETCTPRRWGDQ